MCDSTLNNGRIIRLFGRPGQFAHFCAAFYTFCSQQEAANGVISDMFVKPIVADKLVKLGNSNLNLSREIAPETVRCGIFGAVLR